MKDVHSTQLNRQPADPAELRRMLPEAMPVIERLRGEGFQALFAGGWVRDWCLGREARDVDIASNAGPEEVEALFPRTHALGKAFGVIQVVMGEHTFEVATFRRDLGTADGRHPQSIESASLEEDALRRDFTVNGLYMDPVSGELIDVVGGLADLQAGVIRAIGDPAERFREDHLRMLRAVRFAAVLEFEVDPDTLAAVKQHGDDILKVSSERIRNEFVRTLTESPRPGDALELLRHSGLLRHILPQALEMIGCAQPPEFHPEGDVWTHTVLMLNQLRDPSPELALAVLFHDIGKPATRTETGGRIRFRGHAQVGADMAETWLRAYRFSKREIRTITGWVSRHMDMMNVPNMKKSTLRRLVSRERFEEEMELHRIDCLCSNGLVESHSILQQARAEAAEEAALPDPLITGRDLLDMGLNPGPDIGRWKKRAYEEQLERAQPDKNELKDWLREQMGQTQ